ncbi:hypothetical protein [Persicitalea jodogahamensis]|uniref:Uncharacterized protein n=1 Tax=Persicitalea jodogahamensis TaxID=402147 RepID=A0A8J3GA12_9BACT|nr:hypothetical protein [Persicitalea jodogahamensis]GHB68899.1 hypothetical protein GCM10007390_22980 [Persicitalea jodogahamensis]
MKSVTLLACWLGVVFCGPAQAQKVKIFQAKVIHYDYSSIKGIVYDVSPQGLVMLDKKTVAAMSKKEVRQALLDNQLPTFVVPFQEIGQIAIRRLNSAGRGFGIGYLASFITLETSMVVSTLSDNSMGCDGTQRKPTLGDAIIGASCAAPPGILVFGVVSLVGGGIGSLVGLIPRKQIQLNSIYPEEDARKKLGPYALALQGK